MELILDEWIIREVIDTLYMARTTLLGITGLDSPQEVAKKSANETAITRRISKAIDIIQQSEQPSLPSNLDEAAEKYQSDARIHALDNTPIGTAKDAFIAGAEWMAGQFQKIEGDLVDWYETRDVEYCSGIRTHESFKVPSGFYIKKED